VKIDAKLLERLHKKMSGRVGYDLGAKAPSLDCDSNKIELIDCSGYTRYLFARCAGVVIPDGSQNQLAWARNNLRSVNYRNVMHYCADDPSRYFIAFLSPKPGKAWPRHVWLGRGGHKGESKVLTIESCSSLGVGSRPWDTRILLACKECFEVTNG
jgi:hypothetical protein